MHDLRLAEGIRYLLEKTEKTLYICDVAGRREVADGLEGDVHRLESILGESEAHEVELLLAELKLVRVETNSCPSARVDVIYCVPEQLLHVGLVQEGVVDAFTLVLDVLHDVVRPPSVRIV